MIFDCLIAKTLWSNLQVFCLLQGISLLVTVHLYVYVNYDNERKL